jgi:hypothetical protein
MSAPYEIVCAPYVLWIAPVGSAFPAVDALPGEEWMTVGTSGDLNYNDSGVTAAHAQTIGSFTPAGGTTPRKKWRQSEEFTISVEIADLSPVQYASALDSVLTSVGPAAGVAGNDSFEVMRGVQVEQHALLLRGISPVDEALTAQYEVVAATNEGAPSVVYSKQNPAMLALAYHAFELTPGSLAVFRAQTAAAL